MDDFSNKKGENTQIFNRKVKVNRTFAIEKAIFEFMFSTNLKAAEEVLSELLFKYKKSNVSNDVALLDHGIR